MLMGHTDGLSERRSSKDQILADPLSELGDSEGEDCSEQILYSASFEELASSCIKYDTIIWLSISLLLVLAWGVGLVMLIYLPIRRYVLRKDLSSRSLYVTPTEIVYKVSRPSFIPFWGTITIERRVPLSLVIGIIIEQGCLQSIFGINTFRVESIAYGKAAPVDELQVQGVSDPDLLRRMIITEASKISRDVSGKLIGPSIDIDNMARIPAATEGSVVMRSPSKSWKMAGSLHSPSLERRVPGGLLLNKLEEVNKSVKRLELSLRSRMLARLAAEVKYHRSSKALYRTPTSIVASKLVHFDSGLPHYNYKTEDGVIQRDTNLLSQKMISRCLQLIKGLKYVYVLMSYDFILLSGKLSLVGDRECDRKLRQRILIQ